MRVAAVKRFRAWLLLATFVASLGSSQLTADHLGIVDTACGEIGLGTGEAAQVGTATQAGPQHCPVCHFLRAVSGASATPVASMAVETSALLTVVEILGTPPTVNAITRPSRGPPAATPAFVI